MCGIAGIWDFNNGTSGDLLAKEVNDMAKNIKARGLKNIKSRGLIVLDVGLMKKLALHYLIEDWQFKI